MKKIQFYLFSTADCAESTDISNEFNIIAGAEWEFTNNWNCPGSDLGSEAVVGWDGSEAAIDNRADCAKKCLDEPRCVAFTFPNPPNTSNKKCYWKSGSSQKSTRLGKDCGFSDVSGRWQYYTLLDRKTMCGDSGNFVFLFF